MAPDVVETTADVMVDADECGIDTHGISMIPWYHERHVEGLVTMNATTHIVRDTPGAALLDAGGGMGHAATVQAAHLAIEKAETVGLASVAVRNSNHFGAAGYYTRLVASHGLVGMCTTNASAPRSAPTYGREAKLSTNPLAFAAPAHRNPTFSLDMATTTVAAGKIRNRANEGLDLPVGWVNNADGSPLRDAALYGTVDGIGATLTPLGGTPQGASYKGYGLGAMVEILSACLPGASLVTSTAHGRKVPGTMDLGHFLLAIDPTTFRDEGQFETDVDRLIDDLHATEPVSAQQLVMVAGEPEVRLRVERRETGIPLPPGLWNRLRSIATDLAVPFLLEDGIA